MRVDGYDFTVYKVNKQVAGITMILSAVTYIMLFFPLGWWNLLLLPIFVPVVFISKTLMSRAMTLFCRVLIPAGRFKHDVSWRKTLVHEEVHVKQQRSLGNFKFLMKYLTPQGCLDLESPAYATQILWYIEQANRTAPWSELVDQHVNFIKNGYPLCKLFVKRTRIKKALEADMKKIASLPGIFGG